MTYIMSHQHEHHDHRRTVSLSESSSSVPSASTYAGVFSFSIDTGPLLISSWHPRNSVDYCLSLVLIFALGVASEYCASLTRMPAELCLHDEDSTKRRLFVDGDQQQKRPLLSHQFLLHVVSISINFCLMLLVMTFNVGVFASVVAGVATGRIVCAGNGGGGGSSESCH